MTLNWKGFLHERLWLGCRNDESSLTQRWSSPAPRYSLIGTTRKFICGWLCCTWLLTIFFKRNFQYWYHRPLACRSKRFSLQKKGLTLKKIVHSAKAPVICRHSPFVWFYIWLHTRQGLGSEMHLGSRSWSG